MSLSIVNNVASLNAQQSLNNTNNALNTSLQRLSTGLKINNGADGPAAYVISQQQQAQIAGINTAIDNTNQAVSVVQTAEGALNEVNSLLTQIRGLALNSANSGVNSATSLAANQNQINNALATINSISQTTTINGRNLLNGSSGTTASADTTNAAGVQGATGDATVASGTYAFAVTTQGQGSNLVGVATNGASTVNGGTLQITGGGLTSGVNVQLNAGTNLGSAVTAIQSALNGATTQGGGAGVFKVALNTAGGISITSNVLGSAAIAATSSTQEIANVTGLTTTGLVSTNGAAAGAAGTALAGTVTFTPTGGTAQSAVTVTPTAGPNGLNNQISFGGLNFTVAVGSTGGAQTGTAAAATTTNIAVANNALTFQTGANENQTASISLANTATSNLGTGVIGLSNPATTSLANINVTTAAGAQDAIAVVDQAISQVSSLSGNLGSFQDNTLQANATNLQTTLSNTTSANSVITDTNFSSEIANFTRLQTQLTAGATVLSNANSTTQLITKLLGG